MFKTVYTDFVYAGVPYASKQNGGKMPNKTNSKNSTVKIILATVGAIAVGIIVSVIIAKTKPKEAKPVQLNLPKDW